MPYSYQEQSRRVPHGFGGWLIVAALGVAGTPLFHAVQFLLYIILFRGRTTPGRPNFDPAWFMPMTYAVIASGALTLVTSGAAILFFKKHHRAPMAVIIGYSLSLANTVIRTGLFDTVPTANADWTIVIRSLVSYSIWIAYFLTSDRVGATFVERK